MAEESKTPRPGKEEARPAKAEETRAGVYYTPATDIYETDDELWLEAELPGVSTGGLDVRYENGVVTIVGRVAERGTPGERRVWSEYPSGNYYRAFSMEGIDPEGITADIERGVLRLRLPKAPETRTRKIEVKAK